MSSLATKFILQSDLQKHLNNGQPQRRRLHHKTALRLFNNNNVHGHPLEQALPATKFRAMYLPVYYRPVCHSNQSTKASQSNHCRLIVDVRPCQYPSTGPLSLAGRLQKQEKLFRVEVFSHLAKCKFEEVFRHDNHIFKNH
jgi:hypothetical protein